MVCDPHHAGPTPLIADGLHDQPVDTGFERQTGDPIYECIGVSLRIDFAPSEGLFSSQFSIQEDSILVAASNFQDTRLDGLLCDEIANRVADCELIILCVWESGQLKDSIGNGCNVPAGSNTT